MYLNMNIYTHIWCEWLSKTWTPSGPASMASSSFSFSLQHFNDALVSCAASATWKTPFKPQQHLLCFCFLLSLFNNKFNFSCRLYNVQWPFFPLPHSIRKSSFTPIALVYKICQNPHRVFDNLFKEHRNHENVEPHPKMTKLGMITQQNWLRKTKPSSK